jgi:hypothetical protein
LVARTVAVPETVIVALLTRRLPIVVTFNPWKTLLLWMEADGGVKLLTNRFASGVPSPVG